VRFSFTKKRYYSIVSLISESEADFQERDEKNKLYYFVFTDWLLFARKIGRGLHKKFSLENQYELYLTILKEHPKGSYTKFRSLLSFCCSKNYQTRR
jgi:hypothetical protein